MQPLRTLLLVLALAACNGEVQSIDAGADLPDAAVTPDAPPASAAPPAAMVLSAGGTVESASFTLDVQIGEALVPRPVAAGDTTLAPHGAIQP